MRHSRTGPHGPRSTRRVATALAGVIAVVGAMVITAPVASGAAVTYRVTLTKVWVNPNPGDGVTLQISAGDASANGPSSVRSDGTPTTTSVVLGGIAVGDTVSIGEAADGGTDLSVYQSAFVCSDGSSGSLSEDQASFTMPGEDVTCTITNTGTSVIVNKWWVINGDEPVANGSQPSIFSAKLSLSGQTSPQWGTEYFYGSRTESVTVSEQMSIPEACDAGEPARLRNSPSAVRTDGAENGIPFTNPIGDQDVSLEHGENEIDITNQVWCPMGTLTLIKVVDGPDSPSAWTLTATGSKETGPMSITGKSETKAVTNTPVLAGTYTLTESGPGNYTQASLICTRQNLGLRSPSGMLRDADESNIAKGNTVSIGPWDDVTCKFTNTYNPPPPPPPSPITVTPAFTVQCVLSGGTSNVTVTTTAVTGISYTVTNNGTSSVTVTAAAQPGYALSVPAKWTGNSSSATIVVTAKDATTCVGDESATVVSTTDPSTSTAAVVATRSTSVAVMAASTQVTSLSYTGVKAWQMSVLALLLLGGGALLLTAGSLWRRKPQKH